MKVIGSIYLYCVLAAMSITTAHATVFTLYNNINSENFVGDGSELAAALISPDSGINIVAGTSVFQGNFSGDFNSLEIEDTSAYGSAAFFNDLNFGSIGDTDFVLPDGVLLTSGFASPALENTESGFTGYASRRGDEGLDSLLTTLGDYTSSDATVLSFNFTVDAGINAISLDMIFGTEEYSEYVGDYPEIAAVFVDGINYAGFADGNLLTLTGSTVDGGNFFDNQPSDTDHFSEALAIEYDGVSTPLSLTGLLDPALEVHSIKIAISDTTDWAFDSGLFVANLEGLTLGGATGSGLTSTDPLMPIEGDAPTDGFNFIINVGDLGVGINPATPIFIDPYVATGYEYISSGQNFATVLIPNSYGDGFYNVLVWNGSIYDLVGEIGVGEQFNFLTAGYTNGVSQFMIDGIEISAALDPTDNTAFVTGLTFVAGGSFNISQTPVQTCDGSPDCATVNVPEPSTMLLLIGGLLGFSRIFKRKT